jgi:predicted amidohydrolase YtcJ
MFCLSVVMAQLHGAEANHATAAHLIVRNANITTLDDANPQAEALAVRDGVIIAAGANEAVDKFRGAGTQVLDAGGRRVIPGLNDSHLHVVRAGRFYNLELRWDGVRSLAQGLDMIREQALRTPKGQWVRVIGGWSPYQFKEQRLPTIAELNAAAPDTPVFVLFLYSRGFMNKAGVQALGITEQSAAPAGGKYVFKDDGVELHAVPDPTILYTTIAKLPQLSEDEILNSTKHFYRELNRFGITSVVDAGGGGHEFPTDYIGSEKLAKSGELPVRVSYYLFPQKAGRELNDFDKWLFNNVVGSNMHIGCSHGYELEGGGETLVWAAGDFENFLSPRPELREGYKKQLEDVTTLLVKKKWPIRIHATYDESINKILDVFEDVFRKNDFHGRWIIDHAETASDKTLERIKNLGGGIAIQNRMAFSGEFFVERYGKDAAKNAPPVRKMLGMGIPVGLGTDATRVSSHNPWLSIYWITTGKTMGGTQLFGDDNRLSREEALRLYTVGSAWFSGEEHVKGRIKTGQFADFAILNADCMEVPEEKLRDIESVLTVVSGKPVYATAEFAKAIALEPLPAVVPAWSPVARFGGYQKAEDEKRAATR